MSAVTGPSHPRGRRSRTTVMAIRPLASAADFATDRAGLPGAYGPPGGALLVAEVDGRILGCIALRPLEPPAVGEIKRLYVRPAGRGQRVGAALGRAILECARAAGYERVRLDTLPTMRAAQ